MRLREELQESEFIPCMFVHVHAHTCTHIHTPYIVFRY